MFRNALRASLLSAAVVAVVPPTAEANGHGRVVEETVYTPTSSILALPTAYVVPTSSVVSYAPTSYVTTSYVPTSYVTTSYVPTTYFARSYVPTAYVVEPTSYVATRYVYRPRWYARSWSRPYVTTSARYYYADDVLATAYYLPTTTTLDLPVIPTSYTADACCVSVDPCAVPSGPAVSTGSARAPSAPVTNGSSNGSGDGAFNPDAGDNGDTPRLEGARKRIRSETRPGGGTGAAGTKSNTATANSGTTGGASSTPTGGNEGGSSIVDPPNPVKPADDGGPAPSGDADRREARRPVYTTTARSTLRGQVISVTDGKGTAALKVTLADARGRFKDRAVTTDKDGRFAVTLPEGDWTVAVPSSAAGQVIEQPITVAGGLITDDRDREITSLTINR